ncbi:hypothetical protein MXB_5592 [Myxobolus squamalis]|nr:hypothetical protein MXB_5592 [Myxobolus squamalis]
MNWRFITAVSSLGYFIIAFISLFLALNSEAAKSVGTCWHPLKYHQENEWPLKESMQNNLACPFILQGVSISCISLFLLGYIVVSFLFCFLPPHILTPFEDHIIVMTISYIFIMLMFSISISCIFSAIGLIHYYNYHFSEISLVNFYTGSILRNCVDPASRSCSSIVLLYISGFIILAATIIVVVEIIFAIFSIERRQGYRHVD